MADAENNRKKRPRGVQFAEEIDEAPPEAKRADFVASAVSHGSNLSSTVTASLTREQLQRLKSERQGARQMLNVLQTANGGEGGQSLAEFHAAAGRIGDSSSGGAEVLTGEAARRAQAARNQDTGDSSGDEDAASDEVGFRRRPRGSMKGNAAEYADDASDDGDAGALGGESDDDEAAGGVLVRAEGEEEGGQGGVSHADRLDSGDFKLSDKWGGGQRPQRHTADSPTDTGVSAGDVPIVPFNLKAENDEGYFNAQGDYTARAQTAEDDTWLAELDEHAKSQSAESVAEQQAAAAAAAARASKGGAGGGAAEEQGMHAYTALAWIAQYMSDDDDTVSDTIRRVAKLAKSGGGGSDAAAWGSVSQALSQATDALLQQGAFDIYSYDQEQVTAKLQQAGEMYAKSVGGQAASGGGGSTGLDEDSITWEYKWNSGDAQRDASVYGPYSSQQMYAWCSAKHFEGQPVVVRRCTNPAVLAATSQTRPATSDASGAADDDGDDLLGDLDDDEDADSQSNAKPQQQDLRAARCKPSFAEETWSDISSIDFRFYASKE